jgi:arylsulfatase A-like enzyme
MPNAMGKIAAAGLDLTDTGYVSIPICGPARVSLLVGTYPYNNGTSDNRHVYETYRNRRYHDVDMVARLKRAGYRTGFFGKFMNGYGEYGDPGKFVHPSADRWHVIAGGQSTPEYKVNKDGNIIGGLTHNHTPPFGERARDFVRGARTPSSRGSATSIDLHELSDPSKPWRKRLLVEHPGRGWAMVRGGRYV